MNFGSALLPLLVVFQTAVAQIPKTEKPEALWLQRSQSLTDDLLKDTSSLGDIDEAVVLVRLGAEWWSIDPVESRKWALKAVEAVEHVPSKENDSELTRRLSATRYLLSILAPLDQQLADRLQVILSSAGLPTAERSTNAEALVDAALIALRTDAKRAALLGSAALRVGSPKTLHNLLLALRQRDSILADQLFREALKVARATLDREFLNSLSYAAFPELYGPGDKPVPPKSVREEMLRILADYLQQEVAISVSNRTRDCSLAVALVAPLQTEFDQLGPEHAMLVRQLMRNCAEATGVSPQNDGGVRQSTGRTDTIEGLLTQADQTNDKRMARPVYLAKAAQMAAHQKDFERAIRILDSMTEEERQFIGIWETWRQDWAAALAFEYLNRDDFYGMRQVIKAVPDPLEPFAKIRFVDRFPKDSFPEICIEFLNESKQELANSQKPDSDKANWQYMLVRLYAKCHSENKALEAFKDSLVSLNRVKTEEGKSSNSRQEDLIKELIPPDFPISLFEAYDYIIKDAISSLTFTSTRIRVRLDLLRFTLREYRAQAAKAPTKPKTALRKPR